MANLVYELPHELQNDLVVPHGIFAAGGAFVPTQEKKKLRILRNKEILHILGIRILGTLAVAFKKHAKVDIKLFLPCLVLLDFSILFHMPCPGLSEQKNFWS